MDLGRPTALYFWVRALFWNTLCTLGQERFSDWSQLSIAFIHFKSDFKYQEWSFGHQKLMRCCSSELLLWIRFYWSTSETKGSGFFTFPSHNGPNHLLLVMLHTFVWQHCQWHCLQKVFCLKLPNSVRNAKKFLEALPLAILPTKSLQHCQDQMIWANDFNHRA